MLVGGPDRVGVSAVVSVRVGGGGTSVPHIGVLRFLVILYTRGLMVPTVCIGSSDTSEKIFNIFESENEVYTIY